MLLAWLCTWWRDSWCLCHLTEHIQTGVLVPFFQIPYYLCLLRPDLWAVSSAPYNEPFISLAAKSRMSTQDTWCRGKILCYRLHATIVRVGIKVVRQDFHHSNSCITCTWRPNGIQCFFTIADVICKMLRLRAACVFNHRTISNLLDPRFQDPEIIAKPLFQ